MGPSDTHGPPTSARPTPSARERAVVRPLSRWGEARRMNIVRRPTPPPPPPAPPGLWRVPSRTFGPAGLPAGGDREGRLLNRGRDHEANPHAGPPMAWNPAKY